MRYIISAVFILISVCLHGQNIYTTNSSSHADVKVFVVDKEYRADLIVFKTDKKYHVKPKANNGIWFFCNREYQADKKIFFVDHEYQSDLKVFFTDKEYRSGWKNNEKKHLLY